MRPKQPDGASPTPAQPDADVYAALAGRLGIAPDASVEGPARNPLMGPGDERPIEQLLRLSSQMEMIAAEIRSVRSITYRTQLWQQWAAIWYGRPEHQARLAAGLAAEGLDVGGAGTGNSAAPVTGSAPSRGAGARSRGGRSRR